MDTDSKNKLDEIIEIFGTIEEVEKYFKISKNEFSKKNIQIMFDKIVEEKSVEISIEDLINKYADKIIYIETPDGFQKINKFYKKQKKQIYCLKINNKELFCSNEHLIETNEGWKKTEELLITDLIKTKMGFVNFNSLEKVSKSIVYDFEVNHTNSRYWASDISSHNCGKTYIALNACREAQKRGYSIVYLDTEWAVDKDLISRFGIDVSDDKVSYQPVNTVEDVNKIILTMAQTLIKQKREGIETPKIVLIIDSLGNLSTRRELDGVNEDEIKADMGNKQKLLKKLFSTCTLNAGLAGITIIATQHTIANIGGYGESRTISGGIGQWFNSSTVLQVSKAKLADGSDKKTETGIIATSKIKKSRFTKKGIPVSFHISDEMGMNPFVGLEKYISWDICGIQAGKVNEKGEFEEAGKQIRTFAVKHLNKNIKPSQLFSEKVFTQEVLDKLEVVVSKIFKLADPSTQQFDSANSVLEDISEFAECDNEDDENDENL